MRFLFCADINVPQDTIHIYGYDKMGLKEVPAACTLQKTS